MRPQKPQGADDSAPWVIAGVDASPRQVATMVTGSLASPLPPELLPTTWY